MTLRHDGGGPDTEWTDRGQASLGTADKDTGGELAPPEPGPGQLSSARQDKSGYTKPTGPEAETRVRLLGRSCCDKLSLKIK